MIHLAPIVLALSAAGILIAIAAGFAFGYFYARHLAAIHALQERLQRLEEHNRELEECAAKRHTQATQSNYHDALAVAIDVILEEDAQARYRQARLAQLQKILKVGSTGPYAYPVDPPAGPRPEKGNGGKKEK
jgi:hypothetical protein